MADLEPIDISQALEKFWGYREFRPPQKEVIETLLQQKDALIILPTGRGKSLCFQLPALLQSGLTLVVSPLIALMENQQQQLKQKKLPVGLLHQEMDRATRKETLFRLEKKALRILYLAPETLLSPSIWSRLQQPDLTINGIIVDEAHCLVEWGDSFRPSYSRLGAVRKSLLLAKPQQKAIALAAFTATANPQTQGLLTRLLGLEQPQKFLLSPYRDNLFLQVKMVWSRRCRRHLLENFLHSQGKKSGLVYVRSRQEGEKLGLWLRSQGWLSAPYHAGLAPSIRRERESQWLEGKLPFLVATSALGMGIDKPDLRWIVHYQPPQHLSQYLQEIGRAGRDGQTAHTLLLRSEPTGWLDNSDRHLREFWRQQRERQYQETWQRLPRLPRQGKVEEIRQLFPNGELTLALLHSLGELVWHDPFTYSLLETGKKTKLEPHRGEMGAYLNTHTCRWSFLLQAYGLGEKSFRCGHCDNCR